MFLYVAQAVLDLKRSTYICLPGANTKGMGHKTSRLQSDSWVAGEAHVPESTLFPIGATALDLGGSSTSNQQSLSRDLGHCKGLCSSASVSQR